MTGACVAASSAVLGTVGNAPVLSGVAAWGAGSTGLLTVVPQNPAAAAGTIRTVRLYTQTAAGTAYFATGTFSGGTFTVSAVSAGQGLSTGIATYSVNLAIPVGGLIAIYWVTGSSIGYHAVSGPLTYYKTSVSTPTVGAVYSSMLTFADSTIDLQGDPVFTPP